ncbi:hypothetical protein AKJ09_02960 [Labilithrix luteola]|uniref:Uncharacterized protein n=1 Tax=Labilithrix luteola TaxID=1391654 RepID=A0A0K1PSG0_9BACT|nr:hypothetical protein AKJ09_02960 [Labilithrix luteola]
MPLLADDVEGDQGYGVEADGGVRAMKAGLRIVLSNQGAVSAAEDRFPQTPQTTIALPERLGGGFLFVMGTTLWRADRWLARATPVFTSTQPITRIVPGLDRVYLRAQNAFVAIDGKTGRVLDLGPWPDGPWVADYAAADGWRAIAITDLRGVLATFDAGASWRSVELPIDARNVYASGENLAIGGIENGRDAWYELRADGSLARLGQAPREAKGKTYVTRSSKGDTSNQTSRASSSREETYVPDSESTAVRIFGKRPLAAAVEDGWPLTDGTAIVARDGALGRIRLSDGAFVEVVPSAFPLKPARCHPISLTRPNAPGAFGFVCGEPRGATVLYAYDPRAGRLTELKRFDKPRVVTSSGNGAVAVRGACAADADGGTAPRDAPRLELPDTEAKNAKNGASEKPKEKAPEPEPVKPTEPEVRPFCVLGLDNQWREVHVRGDVGDGRVVMLADGKIAVLSPPQSQTAPARLTVLDNGKATTVPIVFPKVSADIARVLRLGVWLDGFEERRPGVVGGWLEAGGSVLGIEVALDGKATPGQYVRDAGMPFVSGRYGFGWSASKRGYETTDGGMTWTTLELPEPLQTAVNTRACGPVGCLAAGWLRIGWGNPKKEASPAAPEPWRPSTSVAAAHVDLACEPLTSLPPPAPTAKRNTTPNIRIVHAPFGSSPVLSSSNFGVADLPSFYSQPGPELREAERGIPVDVTDLVDRSQRGEHREGIGPLARVYAWGPKTGDWDTQGKWQVKWLSPFAGWPDVRSSISVLPPTAIVDIARPNTMYQSYNWPFAPGEDTAHAILLVRRPASHELVPVELEADRAPTVVRRADGEPFADIDAVVRAAGHWFIATPAAVSPTGQATIIWQVDGGAARELTRVTRVMPENGRSSVTRLARRSDGRSIGLVVDGVPTLERSTPTRWVLPIDIETGQHGDPSALGYTDFAGRTLEACPDDLVGWVLDTNVPSVTTRLRLPHGQGSLHGVYGRVRLTSSRACVERLAGLYNGSSEGPTDLARPGARASNVPLKPGELLVTATAAQTRYPLKCTVTR